MNAAAPPVTDRLAIEVRAYAAPSVPAERKPGAGKPKREPLPASEYTLTFDTETASDAGQALRFGAYEFRYGEALDEAGLFYDPEGVSTDELALLRDYAERHGLVVRTREEFVDEVIYARAFQLRATIVGFNLPFDISRLAIDHGSARTPHEANNGAMRDGFTFKLSRQKIWPNIRVKHLSSRSALVSFAAQMRQRDGRGQRNRSMKTKVRRGHFVDVKTLAAALLSRGFTLAGLCKHLKVENPKLQFEDFDGPIAEEMIRYAVGDVRATWECYVDLSERLAQLGLTRTLPEKIYSEASIGKGYLREMGIAPWRELQPDFPPRLLANILSAYFGGRSEIRIRREVRQVILCDFLSMYPTVCTLMGLWAFVIASGMTQRDATDETQEFLASVDLPMLQSKATWERLATLVRVVPDAGIFPVRAAYEGEAQSTIGANYLTADSPHWFTLADCITSKLLTGKAPAIVEAIAFEPVSVQADLHAVDIGGNPEYRVDPIQADFFKSVIELRQATKAKRDAATGAEYEASDVEQNALKIAANATSYGIYVEVNVERRPNRRAVTVHTSTREPFEFATDLAEMPGSYFHPLLATLITGGARLMLAMTERLIGEHGLAWAFCDTDSMAIAKPEGMADYEFRQRVQAIADWFASLNPYGFGGSILKIEGENASLETGEPQSLYCFAVSSKRYALFNLAINGTPVMRKVSAHGLGHLRAPYSDADAPAGMSVPDKSVLRDGVERWHCDLWFRIVSAALAGKPDQVPLDYHPAMNLPAVSRYSATTPALLRWFKTYNRGRAYRDQVKPFGFLLALRPALDWSGERIAEPRGRGRPRKRLNLKPIAPYDRDHAKASATAFDREASAPVPLSSLETYREALSNYHLHPESKFLDGDYFDRGTTRRRHIHVASVRHIGKESNDWERQAVLGLVTDAQPEYVAPDSSA